MAEGVERFKEKQTFPGLIPASDGQWVRTADYEKARAEVERVRRHEQKTAEAAVQRIEALEAQRDQARNQGEEELRERLIGACQERSHGDGEGGEYIYLGALEAVLDELLSSGEDEGSDPSGEQGEEKWLRERLEAQATKDRLRTLLKEEGWTYLTPNSINNVLDMVVRAATPATKEER